MTGQSACLALMPASTHFPSGFIPGPIDPFGRLGAWTCTSGRWTPLPLSLIGPDTADMSNQLFMLTMLMSTPASPAWKSGEVTEREIIYLRRASQQLLLLAQLDHQSFPCCSAKPLRTAICLIAVFKESSHSLLNSTISRFCQLLHSLSANTHSFHPWSCTVPTLWLRNTQDADCLRFSSTRPWRGCSAGCRHCKSDGNPLLYGGLWLSATIRAGLTPKLTTPPSTPTIIVPTPSLKALALMTIPMAIWHLMET